MIEPVKVLIADDHPVFRSGMRILLSGLADIEVVGIATNGLEAIEMTASFLPDVVLMDLQMPGLSGVEATRQIVATSPFTRILVITMFEDNQSVFTALRAGARGYILKDAEEEQIIRAIRSVSQGEAIFSPAIAQRVLEFFAAPRPAVPPQIFPQLSDRERELLNLIAQGHSNTEIAKELSLSMKTVSNHISNIFSKLQVADRTQAILRAKEAGLG